MFDPDDKVFPDFYGVYDMLERVIKEAGFVYGYKRLLPKLEQLDDEVVEEGLVLTRQVYNLRQKLYRVKEEIDLLVKKRAKIAQAGEYFGEAKEEIDKEIKLAEAKAVVLCFDVIQFREPWEEYLALNDIEERKPYNKRDGS